MLVDLTPIKEEQDRRKEIAKEHNFKYLPQDNPMFKQETGIYHCAYGFNFSEEEFVELENLSWEDRYKIFPNYNKAIYGVADNIEQIKQYYKEQIDDTENKYVIALTPVFQEKENKGNGDGWRWGEYIGELNPQCEYLDDEEFGDDFEYVIVFTIYKVKQ